MNYRTLPATLKLITQPAFKGISVPVQNGEVYPYFEEQACQHITLQGTWKKKRINDPKLTMRIRDDLALSNLRHEIPGFTQADFEDASLEDHVLPGVENKIGHVIEAQGVGMETYEAGAWYRKVITITKKEDKVYLFKALAMSMVADLFINDLYIGTHEGSFNPFSFDVSRALKSGDNVFALRVHNIPWGSRIDTIPAQSGSDYFNYTGVIHDFWIDEIPLVSLRRVDIIPLSLTQAEVTLIAVNKSDQHSALPVKLALYSAKITPQNLGSTLAADLCDQQLNVLQDRVIECAPQGIALDRFILDTSTLQPWELLKPSLGVLKTMTPFETLAFEFGVRTLAVDKRSILLNGKPVFLNGMARHEETLDKGRSLSHEDIVQECLELKKMNLNFTRTAHYPNHPLTYRILDRLGLAAMMEVPLWQHENEHFKAQLKRRIDLQMWREMNFVQRNRPSVFLWSTQNECNGNDYRTQYNRLLVNDLRKHYNDGRLTTQSAAADRPGYSDPSMGCLDVLGYTLYFGIFHGQPHNTETPYLDNAYLGTRDYLLAAHQFHKKPILVSEYGIWSSAGDEVQHAVALSNLRAFVELRNVNFDGTPSHKGFVSGINYWTINDWFVNHNTWIQSMGFKTLDRQDKSIVSVLKPLYKRLISPEKDASSDRHLFMGHQYLNGPRNVIYHNANAFDASKWPFLVLKGDDPMVSDGFDLILTNKKGENRMLKLEKTEETMIFHLWMLEADFLKEMVALTVSFTSSERRLHLRQIDCVSTFKKR